MPSCKVFYFTCVLQLFPLSLFLSFHSRLHLWGGLPHRHSDSSSSSNPPLQLHPHVLSVGCRCRGLLVAGVIPAVLLFVLQQ